MTVLRYIDIVLLVVAAPIMLLIGVSATGYLIGGGAWIVLRVVGIGVERAAGATTEANRQIAIRMAYMLGRLFALAITVILVRKSDGQGAGLAALVVVVFAFTIALGLSAATRPRSR
ncbi:MAG: hypothetical protein ABI323_00380 [Solirubrobacteraceae bacterium]